MLLILYFDTYQLSLKHLALRMGEQQNLKSEKTRNHYLHLHPKVSP
ncbi:hypothetical protein [uncultured Pontibacter sp.]|nr:hypothetical protein [uncultured Pontibacter sp.]